jgi:hypothetical protein
LPGKIVTNSDEPPDIDIAVEPMSWDDIDSHVRYTKHFLLVRVPDSGGQYKGFFYRGGPGPEQVPDLGTDQAAAIKAFREHLHLHQLS